MALKFDLKVTVFSIFLMPIFLLLNSLRIIELFNSFKKNVRAPFEKFYRGHYLKDHDHISANVKLKWKMENSTSGPNLLGYSPTNETRESVNGKIEKQKFLLTFCIRQTLITII